MSLLAPVLCLNVGLFPSELVRYRAGVPGGTTWECLHREGSRRLAGRSRGSARGHQGPAG